MATNKFLSRLQKHAGAVIDDYNPHNHVIRTPSPSVNFCFGKGHGIGAGLSLGLGGPPKGGKTLLCNAFTGQIHAEDPEAVVLKYNTEYRERGQSTKEERQRVWGIQPERYLPIETNSPMEVFDHIEKEVAAECEDGMKLKLIIIDSINGIQGRRALDDDTIATQQRGDLALTLQEGFKRILPVQRKHNICIIATCHIRAEQDPLEVKRGNKTRLAMPYGVGHLIEYFAYIEKNRNVAGRKNLAEEDFTNEDLTDLAGKSEQTGHKIIFKIMDSSVGPKGRTGEFTLNYQKGIVNVWEEVVLLGVNRGVIERPSARTYKFGQDKWDGKQEMWDAVQKDQGLQTAIVAEVKRKDQAGAFQTEDDENEKEPD